MQSSHPWRLRGAMLGLLIILLPWLIGFALLGLRGNADTGPLGTDTTTQPDPALVHDGIRVDWTFYPRWQFKPLAGRAAAYLVFMFHYTNTSDRPLCITPLYTFIAADQPRQSANEEIAMYIEDQLEDRLQAQDQTPISFCIPPGARRHYIVVFEKPPHLQSFYVQVDIMDIWQDHCLRIHYRKTADGTGNPVWVNNRNEWVGS